MYKAILYDGQLTLTLSYRTAATDVITRTLMQLLDDKDRQESEQFALNGMCLHLGCTLDIQVTPDSKNSQLEAIAAFWQFYITDLRTEHILSNDETVYSILPLPDKAAHLWQLYQHTMPCKFVERYWRVAWSKAQDIQTGNDPIHVPETPNTPAEGNS